MHIPHYKFFLLSLLTLGAINLYGADSRKETRKQEKIEAVIQNFGEQNIRRHVPELVPELLEAAPKLMDLTSEQRHRADLLAYATICGHKRKKSPKARRVIALTVLKLHTSSALWASEHVEQEAKNYIALEAFFNSENSEPLLQKTQEDLAEHIEQLEAQKTALEKTITTLTKRKRT